MDSSRFVYIAKSKESLAGAESEFANRRYNNCANRCYYACYQAAIAALTQAGIKPQNPHGKWSHDAVQAQFIGQLINRRKIYPSSFREVFERSIALRQMADYQTVHITEDQIGRVLRRIRLLVEAIAKEVK